MSRLLAPAAALSAALASAATAAIDLDAGTTHQTMSGWECTTFVAEPCDPAFDAVRDAVLPLAVEAVGIDRVRLEVRSGVENTVDHYQDYVDAGCPAAPDPAYQTWRANRYATVDDNGDPDVIDPAGFHFTELDATIERVVLPMRALVEARGESLHVNLCYVAFTAQIQGGGYHHDDPAEYAELVLATYLHMDQTYGFVPDTWELVLEPDLVAQWNGTRLGEALVAAAQKLQAHGYAPRFVAPSNSTMSQILTYIDYMLAVPGALDHLVMLSYHRYGANPTTLAEIAGRAVANGLQTGMLEWWFDNATYDVLHEDLTLGRNSSWQGAVLRGLFDVDDADTSNVVVTPTPNTLYERQYFRYVRDGAVRIGAVSDEGRLRPVAFVNADGTWVVVTWATSGGAVEIDGLPAGAYGIVYTTGAPSSPPLEAGVELTPVDLGDGETLTTAIPAQGLITVYGLSPAVSAPEPASSSPARVAFPSPVRGATAVAYTLPRAGLVVLDLFDVAGRRCDVIVHGARRAGAHVARWPATELPAGLYLYRLRLDGHTMAAGKVVVAP